MSGERLGADGRTTKVVIPFQYDDRPTRLGQVSSGDKTVVTATNNDDVVVRAHEFQPSDLVPFADDGDKMNTMTTFLDAEGVQITYDVYPAKKPKGVILLVHGLGDHAKRYVNPATAFANAGYTVYTPDMRGHGRTGLEQWGGDESQLGHLGPGGLRATIRDIRQMTEIIRHDHPKLPIFFIGHSMGSLQGQILINTDAQAYAGVVLSGTAYRRPGFMNAGDLNKRFAVAGGNGNEWLSRDPKVATDFAKDPLTFKADTLKLFGLADGLRLFGTPVKGMPRVPILIFIGGEDSLGGEKSVLKLADAYIAAGQDDVTVMVYPGGRHEMFNETNRQEVYDDVISWISERTAS